MYIKYMKVAVYAPIALWEIHFAQAIDIIWKDYLLGEKITFFHCNRNYSSCAANVGSKEKKCRECIFQVEKSIQKHLPRGMVHKWLETFPLEKRILEEIGQLNSHADMAKYSFNNHQFGKAVVSQLATEEREVEIPTELIINRGKDLLTTSLGSYFFFKDAFKEGFDKLYVFGGRRASECPAVFAARDNRLEVFFFEQGSSKSKYLLTNNDFFTLNGFKKELLNWKTKKMSDGYSREHLDIAKGFFTATREMKKEMVQHKHFLRKNSLPIPSSIIEASKPVLSVFTSSAWEFVTADEKGDVPQDFRNTYATCLRLATDPDLLRIFTIVLRWHPNLEKVGASEKELLKNTITGSKNAVHIRPEDKINSYILVEKSEKVVIVGHSTIGIEAAFMKKPVILLGRAQYSSFGSVYEPNSYSDFKRLIMGNLEPLPIDGAVLWAHWVSTYGEEMKFVKQKENAFYIQDERIRQRSIPFKIHERWQKLKHLLKQIYLFYSDG